MSEALQQLVGILRGVWRFRWIALAVAVVICLIGWSLVLLMPDKYEASARVFVDPSTALKPVIQGLAIEQDVNAELNLVRQTLLGADNLKKIMTATRIGADATTPQEQSQTMDDLRSRINIIAQGSAPASSPEEESHSPSKIYTISFQDTGRDRSLKVVRILLDSFVTDTLGGKRKGSAAAQQFVEGQIKEYEKRLNDAEQRLADFKKQNVGMVPGDNQGDYFSRLQNELDAVKKGQTALNIAFTRHAELERQLRGEAPIAASTATPSTTAPGVPGGGDTLSRIKEAQARLEDLLLRYTDKHPDVIALKETIAQLKQRREAELEALRRGDAGAAAATGVSANPVYQSIQLALNQSDVEIAQARGELVDHERRVAELKQVVNTMPQVEAEFARLNRDYTVTKAQYNALVERLEKAHLGEEAEATGSVRFEVIDPPAVGFNPVSPPRNMLLATVLLAGLAGGAGLAWVINLLRPVFHNVRELGNLTGVSVLGAISVSRSAAQTAALRRHYVTYALACAMLVVALVAVLLLGREIGPMRTLL